MLTENQKADLRLAIERAQGFGSCSYVNEDGSPRCVIAQLAAIRGVTPKPWDQMGVAGLCETQGLIADDLRVAFSDLPLYLLAQLQQTWDRNTFHGVPLAPDEDAARQAMLELVEAA